MTLRTCCAWLAVSFSACGSSSLPANEPARPDRGAPDNEVRGGGFRGFTNCFAGRCRRVARHAPCKKVSKTAASPRSVSLGQHVTVEGVVWSDGIRCTDAGSAECVAVCEAWMWLSEHVDAPLDESVRLDDRERSGRFYCIGDSNAACCGSPLGVRVRVTGDVEHDPAGGSSNMKRLKVGDICQVE